jgi:serine/threonine protein kinase
MPNYIDLYDEFGQIGSFDLPPRVRGLGEQEFTLVYARKAGSNGVVFEARQESQRFNPVCAVKVLKRQDATRLARFANEIRIQSAFDHPRVMRIFDSGHLVLGGRRVPWAAMELGEKNLRQHVDDHGPLPRERVVPTALDICEALAALHDKEIIHRDVKPENFVWSRRDDRASMIDFGIAKYVGDDVSVRPQDDLTRQQEFVGPLAFVSPELVEYSKDKSHPVDFRSDVYQAAKVIWFLATGRTTGGRPSKKLCPFGGPLQMVVEACLDDDPDGRPATIREVAAAIEGIS